MAYKDRNDIVRELRQYLRNKLTDPKGATARGTSTQTDEFNGDGNNKTFTLTKSGAKNVKTVTVGGVAQSYGTDYTVDYDTSPSSVTVTFASAPAVGTNNVDITYNYGNTWIYPDSPRTDLTLGSFPRVGITDVSEETREYGLNAVGWMTGKLISIIVVGTDEKELKSIIKEILENIKTDCKSFYYHNFIKPVSVGPVTPYDNDHTEVIQQTVTLEIPYIYES